MLMGRRERIDKPEWFHGSTKHRSNHHHKKRLRYFGLRRGLHSKLIVATLCLILMIVPTKSPRAGIAACDKLCVPIPLQDQTAEYCAAYILADLAISLDTVNLVLSGVSLAFCTSSCAAALGMNVIVSETEDLLCRAAGYAATLYTIVGAIALGATSAALPGLSATDTVKGTTLTDANSALGVLGIVFNPAGTDKMSHTLEHYQEPKVAAAKDNIASVSETSTNNLDHFNQAFEGADFDSYLADPSNLGNQHLATSAAEDAKTAANKAKDSAPIESAEKYQRRLDGALACIGMALTTTGIAVVTVDLKNQVLTRQSTCDSAKSLQSPSAQQTWDQRSWPVQPYMQRIASMGNPAVLTPAGISILRERRFLHYFTKGLDQVFGSRVCLAANPPSASSAAIIASIQPQINQLQTIVPPGSSAAATALKYLNSPNSMPTELGMIGQLDGCFSNRPARAEAASKMDLADLEKTINASGSVIDWVKQKSNNSDLSKTIDSMYVKGLTAYNKNTKRSSHSILPMHSSHAKGKLAAASTPGTLTKTGSSVGTPASITHAEELIGKDIWHTGDTRNVFQIVSDHLKSTLIGRQ